MSSRRLFVAIAAAVVAVGCGLDVAGSAPGTTSQADGGGPMNGFDGGPSKDSGFPLDGSDDGAIGPDADGGAVETLSVKLANAPTTPDLTQEGTIDWAHWGVNASATPVRHATGGGLIGDYTLTGTSVQTGSNGGSGWPIFAKWTNGDATHPIEAATNTFRYFTSSDDTIISWTVPASAQQRELGIYFAVGQAKARVTAGLSTSASTTTVNVDTGAAGNQFLRAAISYASPVAGATVQVRLIMAMRYNVGVTSALSLGSVTLH